MMREWIEEIQSGRQIRQNLISLRREIQEEKQKRALAYLLEGEYGIFVDLLKHEDAKVRKNAALILGEMECEEVLPDLVEAYEREETLFVRSDFLKAIRCYEYDSCLPMLKERKRQIEQMDITQQESKHLREELSLLQNMILQYEKPKKHLFTGDQSKRPVEVILLTNRCQREATRRQIPEEKVAMLAGGVRFRTDQLDQILKIRTWREMLFPIPGLQAVEGTPEQIGKMIGTSKITSFVQGLHEGKPPFYFRVELRGKMPIEKKGSWIRKMAAELEESSGRNWINSSQEYEIEIRLIQTKEEKYVPLLKLYTIEDERFSYRREYLPTSIAPVNAALLMELAKEYLKEDAQILDPFCGVGTMLIERNACVKARTMYGLDILEEAVEKARENTKRAELPIHYINRNFFDFEHEYLFDEIVTNFPGQNKNRDEEQIGELYRKFFEKAMTHLKDGGIVLLYSSEKAWIQRNCRRYPQYRICREYVINEKENQSLFVLQVNQKR
ncbi:MAG: methyltransferase [Lachnospiraceae bacterium]|nr:methyltransferase [Lachnospiraceae bacterium]